MRRTVLTACAPPVLIALDFATTSVAARSIAAGLDVGPRALAWIFSAYSLAFGCLLLSAGRVADARGAWPTLRAGLCCFAVGAGACAAAPTAAVLLGARMVQGAGAALMTPSALAIVGSVAGAEARRRALSAYGVAISAGFVIGTLASGALTTALGWRAAIASSVPLSAAALALALGRRGSYDGARAEARSRLNAGAVAAVVLVAGAGAAVGGAVALAVIAVLGVAVSWRRPPVPRRLAAACGAGFLITATAVAGTLALGVQLQASRGYSALGTGAVFAFFGLAALPGARLATAAARRLPSAHLLAAGLAAQGAGLLLCGAAAAAGPAAIGVAVAVFGLGHVAGNVAAVTVATAAARPDARGEASGILTTAQYVGGALGPALLASAGGLDRGGLRPALLAAGALAVVAAIAAASLRPILATAA